MSSERYFNASEAAKETGKSVVTIRHYLAAKKFPNAQQTAKGKVLVWRIPLTDLVAAGLMDKVTSSPQEPQLDLGEFRATALETRIAELEAEVRGLRELMAEKQIQLDLYRDKERASIYSIETREAQERRRFNWFRRNS